MKFTRKICSFFLLTAILHYQRDNPDQRWNSYGQMMRERQWGDDLFVRVIRHILDEAGIILKACIFLHTFNKN